MLKKSITVEINQDIIVSLGELSTRTGRKKNLLVGAAMKEFLSVHREEQEEIIKKYLESCQD